MDPAAAADTLNSKQVLRKIFDAAREAVIVVDADLRVAHANVAAAEAFGRDGIHGLRLSEILRDLDIHEAFRKAVVARVSADVRLELPTKEKRKFDVHMAPIELDGGAFAIGFFYETTQIDRLEIIRQEFLSNISHELRTPLTSILAFVETLEEGGIDDPDNNRHFLTVIRRNAERMHELIADILELSMIESGNVSVDIREMRLFNTIDDVFSALSAKARDRDVTLKNEVPRATLIYADPVRLGQMLTNLVDNAIKFNRHGGDVNVRHSMTSTADIISVADSGEGILPEHSQRIFERLYRADRARSREVGGTGLGLAIVKHLARLHGGEVSVDSALGSGSTFIIELPAR
jgi:two-component system, OmpR family, phosphate regulon sensor histidine kinase PhoR